MIPVRFVHLVAMDELKTHCLFESVYSQFE